jgi:hypothetical protein
MGKLLSAPEFLKLSLISAPSFVLNVIIRQGVVRAAYLPEQRQHCLAQLKLFTGSDASLFCSVC